MRNSRTVRILLYYVAPPLLFVVAFALVLILYNTHHQTPEVDVTASGFAQNSVEITEGEAIHFVNQSPSVTEVLCLGQNKVCDANATDPAALKSPGLRLLPGQSRDIVFENYGTFYITSPTRPDMDLTITVDAAG